MTPAEAAMMGELNRYRKILKMKEVKFRGSSAALADAVLGMAKRVLKVQPDDPAARARIAAPVVAEGAYANNRQAEAKTGHTTSGKTKQQEKREMKKEKAATKAANTKAAKAPERTVGKDTTRSVGDGELHLSDIAAHIKMAPKHARARARKNAGAIGKLEVKGKKYVFPKAARDKVAAILKG